MKKDDNVRPRVPAMDRRDLMRIGAGVVMTTLNAPTIFGQEEGGEPRRRAVRPEGVNLATGAGYKNEANRLSGNGKMDHTSRQLVSYVNSFSDSQLNEPAIAGLNKLMLDCIVALIGSFG